MSQINVNLMADSQGGSVAPISSVMRNRIINGDMRIDQRNAGAAVTPTNGQYLVDRWFYGATQTNRFTTGQGSGGAPIGFTNYLAYTSASVYSVLAGDFFITTQQIEGFNVSDLNWGTANARTITLSFVVLSSLTGTFGGSLRNSAANRAYPFTYSIPTANTFTTVSVTIPGDTSGTWLTNNGIGISVSFSLGTGSTFSGTAGAWAAGNFVSATGATSVVGTNGATFYITGVQLEKGTQATGFEYRQIGTELALCQRYFQTSYPIGVVAQGLTNVTDGASFICINTSDSSNGGLLPVSMRATPTFTVFSSNGGVPANSARNNASGANVSGITLVGGTTNNIPRLSLASGLGTLGTPFSAHYVATAEL